MSSSILTMGDPAPAFTLNDLDGRPHSLADGRGRIVVINFWSAECGWSERADQEILPALQRWGNDVLYFPVAANVNEPEALLRQVSAERGLTVVLRDPDGTTAERYHALTTPHFFVVDPQGMLRYQGAFDDVSFRQRKPTQAYLIPAVDALLAGRQPDPAITPTFGCTIVHYAGE